MCLRIGESSVSERVASFPQIQPRVVKSYDFKLLDGRSDLCADLIQMGGLVSLLERPSLTRCVPVGPTPDDLTEL